MTRRQVRRALSHERGQAFALFAVSILGLVAMVAFVVDTGRAYNAHRQLQAAADAVATATADQLADVELGNTTLAAAEASAKSYSAESGQKNYNGTLPGVSTTFQGKCVTVNGTVPAWCDVNSKPNAIVVTQSVNVKTIFAKIVGIDSFNITAKATATMGGGKPKPAHIMIVMDRTGSMSKSCSQGGTKLSCAKAGVNSFLLGMDPVYDQIGLAVLPPASTSGGACAQPKTSDGAPNDYDVYTNGYVLTGLLTDYRASATAPLNASSALVSDVSCMKAGGTTAYATAIDKAQAVLAANHDPKAQDVIVFFTDGEATYGPCVDTSPNDSVCDNNSSTYRSRPCYQATQSAAAAKTAGTWIYTILYDTSSSDKCWAWKSSGTGTLLSGGSGSCNVKEGIQFLDGCYESPTMTAYATVQAMATDSSKFYFSPSPGSLTTIFQNIAEDIGEARLVDNSYLGN
jgi:Flp pilus assembly protein TadG